MASCGTLPLGPHFLVAGPGPLETLSAWGSLQRAFTWQQSRGGWGRGAHRSQEAAPGAVPGRNPACPREPLGQACEAPGGGNDEARHLSARLPGYSSASAAW